LTQKQAFSKKKVFAGLELFFVPKMAQDTSLRGAKVAQGGDKISPGEAAAPLLPAPMAFWHILV